MLLSALLVCLFLFVLFLYYFVCSALAGLFVCPLFLSVLFCGLFRLFCRLLIVFCFLTWLSFQFCCFACLPALFVRLSGVVLLLSSFAGFVLSLLFPCPLRLSVLSCRRFRLFCRLLFAFVSWFVFVVQDLLFCLIVRFVCLSVPFCQFVCLSVMLASVVFLSVPFVLPFSACFGVLTCLLFQFCRFVCLSALVVSVVLFSYCYCLLLQFCSFCFFVR